MCRRRGGRFSLWLGGVLDLLYAQQSRSPFQVSARKRTDSQLIKETFLPAYLAYFDHNLFQKHKRNRIKIRVQIRNIFEFKKTLKN